MPEGNDGVRDCLISIRLARETGWTSGIPPRKAKVLTCTDLAHQLCSLAIATKMPECDSPVRALSRNILVQRVPRNALHIVSMFAERIYALACHISSDLPAREDYNSPVAAFQIVAVLSVDPARKNSLSGLQEISYTCFVVTLVCELRAP